jgi:hypothetical protein
LNLAEECAAGLHEAGCGDGRVASVATVMMVRGGEKSGIASDAATGLKMIDEGGIGAQGCVPFFVPGKIALGIAMAVGRDYEVSMQVTLAARRVRK